MTINRRMVIAATAVSAIVCAAYYVAGVIASEMEFRRHREEIWRWME